MPIVFAQPEPFDIRLYPMGRQGGVTGLPSGGGGGGNRGGGGGGRQPSDGGGEGDGGNDYPAFEGIDTQPTEDQIAALQDQSDTYDEWALDQDVATRNAEAQGDNTYDEAGTGYVPGTPDQEAAGGVQAPPNQQVADNSDNSDEETASEDSGETDEETGDPGSTDSQQPTKQTPDAYMPQPTVAPGQPGPNTPGAQRPVPQPQPQQPPPPPEFTQADALDLSRLQNSLAQMRTRLRNGELDAGTARRVNQLIQRGIRPLQALQQVAQQRRDADAHDKMMHARAAQTSMDNMDATQRAAMVRQHSVTLPNGNMLYTPPGETRPVVIPAPKDTTARDEARGDQQDRALNERARNHVSGEMAKEEKDARDLPPDQQPSWIRDPEGRTQERGRRIREYIRESNGNLGGSSNQPSGGQQNAGPAPNPAAQQAAQQRLGQIFRQIAMPSPIARPTARAGRGQLGLSDQEWRDLSYQGQ